MIITTAIKHDCLFIGELPMSVELSATFDHHCIPESLYEILK